MYRSVHGAESVSTVGRGQGALYVCFSNAVYIFIHGVWSNTLAHFCESYWIIVIIIIIIM